MWKFADKVWRSADKQSQNKCTGQLLNNVSRWSRLSTSSFNRQQLYYNSFKNTDNFSGFCIFKMWTAFWCFQYFRRNCKFCYWGTWKPVYAKTGSILTPRPPLNPMFHVQIWQRKHHWKALMPFRICKNRKFAKIDFFAKSSYKVKLFAIKWSKKL